MVRGGGQRHARHLLQRLRRFLVPGLAALVVGLLAGQRQFLFREGRRRWRRRFRLLDLHRHRIVGVAHIHRCDARHPEVGIEQIFL